MASTFGTVSAQPLAYGPMETVGTLDDKRISESSGLAASIRNPGLLWTHNDSGGDGDLFLLDPAGEVRGRFTVELPAGEKAVDWEDMCSFELDGRAWLLVGDVGDNQRRRPHVTLWLIPEPSLESDTSPPRRNDLAGPSLVPARRIDVSFADGPRDIETVAVDPTTRTVVLVSKEWPDRKTGRVGYAGVYSFTLPDASTAEPVRLERQATLNLKIVTAGDISADGRRAVLLTYGDAYQYSRDEGETWAEALGRDPTVVALGPRGQSEGACYDTAGRAIYFTAEKVGRPIWRVEPTGE